MINHEVEGTVQSVAGKVQGAAGAITGDTVMEAAGKAREVAGNIEARAGAALDKARFQAVRSPLGAMFAAGSVGFLLGILFARSRDN
jgi:uncharacterized protein YjbJ (UPF0337 family)